MWTEIAYTLISIIVVNSVFNLYTFFKTKRGSWRKGSFRPRKLPSKPKVVFNFSHNGELPAQYAPLLCLRKVDIEKQDVVPDLLDELTATATIQLVEKRHELPFSKRESRPPFVAIARGGSKMVVALRASAPQNRSNSNISNSQSVVESLNIALEPSLSLENVAPTLINLQKLIDDSFLSSFRDFLVITCGFKWMIVLGLWAEAFIEYNLYILEWLFPIWLSDATAYPVNTKGGHHQLEFYFSGHVKAFRYIPVPFFAVHLPHVIIPGLHAELDDLITEQPLATAELLHDRFPALQLGLAASGLASAFSSKLTVRGLPPHIGICQNIVDGTVSQIEIGLAGDSLVELQVEVSGTFDKDKVILDLSRAKVSQDGNDLLAVQGSLELSNTPQKDSQHFSVLEMLIHSADTKKLVNPLDLKVLGNIDGQGVNLSVKSSSSHPLFKGHANILASVVNARLKGSFGVTTTLTDRKRDLIALPTADLTFAATLKTDTLPNDEASSIYDGKTTMLPILFGLDISGSIVGGPDGGLEIRAEAANGAYSVSGKTDLPEIPEIDFDQGIKADWSLEGNLELNGQAKLKAQEEKAHLAEVDFKGTSGQLSITSFKCGFGSREFQIPQGLVLEARITASKIVAGGLGRTDWLFSWDFNDGSPILKDSKKGKNVELLMPELLDGGFTCHVGPEGCFEVLSPYCKSKSYQDVKSASPVAGGSKCDKGIYDWHFFNSILNPSDDPDHLVKMLDEVPLTDKVVEVAEILSEDIHKIVVELVKSYRKFRAITKEMGVIEPKEVVPGREMARLITKFLYDGDESNTDRMYAIVKQTTDGNGLNMKAVKEILSESQPSLDDYPFEVDQILRWFNNLFTPTPPMAEIDPQSVVYDPPTCQLKKYKEMFKDIPTAKQIYSVVDSDGHIDKTFAEMLALVAPFLTRHQVEYILQRERKDWPEHLKHRLKYIKELKQRTMMIMYQYGGPEYFPQSMFISMFLGEACFLSAQPKAYKNTDAKVKHVKEKVLGCSLLGPTDVAVLLNACMSSLDKSQANNTNIRLLLNLLQHQPPLFLKGVLMEMANMKRRVLGTSLLALLEIDQSLSTSPIDLVGLFESKLGLPIPRRKDYMAGGRWARDSYYEASQRAAQQISYESESYTALKHRLQTFYCKPDLQQSISKKAAADVLNCLIPDEEKALDTIVSFVPNSEPTDERRKLLEELTSTAKESIASADLHGKACKFQELPHEGSLEAVLHSDHSEVDAEEKARRDLAVQSYKTAFAACRALLAEDQTAFHQDWLKEFFHRNYQALMILSVVENVKDDVDKVRLWLKAQSGFGYEDSDTVNDQTLVDKVLDAMYYFEEEREALRQDPLVRLLIPEPPGHYNFTIVSCMGVVTDGKAGREMETAVARLSEKRGVHYIRSDTATVRSPDYNAVKIEEAIRSATTPFGWIGYSQGAANGFLTEGKLMGGTPEEQNLIKNLVTRMILFNAANGSCHGTCGNWKIDRAARDGELFLKHYQGKVSQEVIDNFIKISAGIMQSRESMRIATGFQSLSYSACKQIFQELQFKADVPTCSIKAIVEEVNLPEALHLLSNALTKQMEREPDNPLHDTQVNLSDAVAHPIWVINENTKVLENCDIGTICQRTSHWSPLVKATAHITTPSDIERSVYDTPKDRHLFPWVEVNARFGFIQMKETICSDLK